MLEGESRRILFMDASLGIASLLERNLDVVSVTGGGRDVLPVVLNHFVRAPEIFPELLLEFIIFELSCRELAVFECVALFLISDFLTKHCLARTSALSSHATP
jgi:hypothetical protein